MRKNNTKSTKMNTIFWYVLISIGGIILTIIIYESIARIMPNGGTFLGFPFNWAWFVFGLIMIFSSVIIYLFFKKYRNKINKKGRLN
ncbi:MAG: hypothetical protein ACFFDF_13835 [Candidatus Odinarchaeota archaeon]